MTRSSIAKCVKLVHIQTTKILQLVAALPANSARAIESPLKIVHIIHATHALQTCTTFPKKMAKFTPKWSTETSWW